MGGFSSTLDDLHQFLQTSYNDVIAIQETWLTDSPCVESYIANTEYSIFHKNRNSRGAGVAMLIKNNIDVDDNFDLAMDKKYEMVGVKLNLDNKSKLKLWCWSVYIPPILQRNY